MKYKFILFMGVLFYSDSATAQNISDCNKTLELSADNIIQIFKSLEDRSIRGEKSGENIGGFSHRYSTICLEGQIKNATVTSEGAEYSMVEFIMLSTASKDASIKMYNSLKQLLQSNKPKNWYEDEFIWKKGSRKNFGAGKGFFLTDEKEEKNDTVRRASKRLDMRYYQTFDKYLVTMSFAIWNLSSYDRTQQENETFNNYYEILDGLKDGSLRGAEFGPNRWKSKIILEGQINSDLCNIQSEDYGKNRGTASVVYWFLDGEKGNTDESLKLFEELKQKLKMFKPEGWHSDDFEMPDKSIKRYYISKSSEGYTIDLYWNDGNDVFIQFVSTWEK